MEQKRKKLIDFINSHPELSITKIAEQSKIAASSIYKFLQGADIRLTTWDAIEKFITKIEKEESKTKINFRKYRCLYVKRHSKRLAKPPKRKEVAWL